MKVDWFRFKVSLHVYVYVCSAIHDSLVLNVIGDLSTRVASMIFPREMKQKNIQCLEKQLEDNIGPVISVNLLRDASTFARGNNLANWGIR